MDSKAQLEVLAAAAGNPALLSLATVDLAHATLSLAERSAIKEALQTASVPHWADAAALAFLLDVPVERSTELLVKLRVLTVVEPFPARGHGAVNVHEATRLALRDRLRGEQPARFQDLSRRAASYFAQDAADHSRIESLYHLFTADPERAATACEELDRELTVFARPEPRQALASALDELLRGDGLSGAARAEALLAVAEWRRNRAETTELEPLARDALATAEASGRVSTRARAHALLGDVLEFGGQPEGALEQYQAYLRLSQRLVREDDAHIGWRRELGVAYARLGDLLRRLGRDGAEPALEACLSICRELSRSHGEHAGYLRGLAVAQAQIGDLAAEQGRFDKAVRAMSESLALAQRLLDREPDNPTLRRDLGVYHSKIGDAFAKADALVDAFAAYERYLEIFEGLVVEYPTHAAWVRSLGLAHFKIGDVLARQGQQDGAVSHLRDAERRLLEAIEMAPGASRWRQDLDDVRARQTDVEVSSATLPRGTTSDGVR